MKLSFVLVVGALCTEALAVESEVINPPSLTTSYTSQLSQTSQDPEKDLREDSQEEGRIIKVIPVKERNLLVMCILPCPQFDQVVGYEVTREFTNGKKVTTFEKLAPVLPKPRLTIGADSADLEQMHK